MERKKISLLLGIVAVLLATTFVFSVELGKGKYKDFLEKVFSESLSPGERAFINWNEGLKRYKNFDLVKVILSKVEIIEEKEGVDGAEVLVELEIKAYSKTSSGQKVTFICKRLIGVLLEIDAKTEKDCKNLVILMEDSKIVDGWDGPEV